MRAIRLFQPEPLGCGMTLTLNAAGHHHLSRVLRRRVGDSVILFNGDGCEYTAEIIEITRQHSTVAIHRATPNICESPLALTLCLAWLKNDAMDRSMQKAVELGVHSIRPMLTERGEAACDGERLAKKMLHWQAIIEAAATQCGRAFLPAIHLPQAFAEVMAACEGRRWIASPWHTNGEENVRQNSEKARALAVAIGPEGGFSPEEVALAVSLDWQTFTLGKRILRADTAVIAALSRAQLYHGDF